MERVERQSGTWAATINEVSPGVYEIVATSDDGTLRATTTDIESKLEELKGQALARSN